MSKNASLNLTEFIAMKNYHGWKWKKEKNEFVFVDRAVIKITL